MENLPASTGSYKIFRAEADAVIRYSELPKQLEISGLVGGLVTGTNDEPWPIGSVMVPRIKLLSEI